MQKKLSPHTFANWLAKAISEVPEPKLIGKPNDEVYLKKIIKHSALKSSSVSASLALPGGLWGYVSMIPDMAVVWQIQSQLISNIAAAHGKHHLVTREQMLWCMFRQIGVGALKEVIVQQGSQYIVKQMGPKLKKQILEKIGYNVLKASGGKAFGRIVPLVGTVSAGALTYYDTWRVGKNAMEFYSRDVILLPEPKDK